MKSFDQVCALMFDLDNTLIVRRYSLQKLARRIVGFYFPDDTQRRAGIEKFFCDCFINGYDRRRECFLQFRAGSGMDESVSYEAFRELWMFYYPFSSVADPGAEAVLTLRDRGYAASILTNGEFVLQNAKIDAAGLRPWFSPIVTSQELGLEKPDPRAFLRVCEMMGLPPERVAYVGDYCVSDIAGARSAGMPTVWYGAYSEWDEAIPRADAEISSLWQLLDIFK